MTQSTFMQCFQPVARFQPLLAHRMFRVFDPDNHGVIYFPVFVTRMNQLRKSKLKGRVKLAYEGYDVDEDGSISREDFAKLYEAYARAAFMCKFHVIFLYKNDVV